MENLAIQMLMHDLKAPLTALKILRARRKDGRPDESLLKATLHSLETLLARCVGESHPEAKGLNSVQIETICRDLIAQKQIMFKNNFILEPIPDDAHVKLGAIDLQKILSNLLHNAAEASQDSGGAITLAVHVQSGHIDFVVRDQGRGLDPLALAALKRGTPLNSRGWGVGMLIVQQLVKQSGGQLELVSEVGHGTKARVTWSIAQRANSAGA